MSTFKIAFDSVQTCEPCRKAGDYRDHECNPGAGLCHCGCVTSAQKLHNYRNYINPPRNQK